MPRQHRAVVIDMQEGSIGMNAPSEGHAGLRIEFCNPSPDTVLVLPVDAPELGDLAIPDEAVSYGFFKYGPSGSEFVGPQVFLSLDPIFGSGDEMIWAGHLDREGAAFWRARCVEVFGLVTWEDSGDGKAGQMVVPLVEGIVLMRRATREIVWPAALASEMRP